jgi:hypothetical protein
MSNRELLTFSITLIVQRQFEKFFGMLSLS